MTDESPPKQAVASLLLLCGLPASGKSTFARTILDLHNKRCCQRRVGGSYGHGSEESDCNDTDDFPPENVPIVSRFDKIVLIDYDSIAQQELSFCSGKNGKSEDAGGTYDSNDLEAWRTSRVTALDNLKDTLLAHFSADNNASSLLIIMDDNFHLRSMRRDVYRTCQDTLSILPTPLSINDVSQNQISFSTVYFSTQLEVCLQRNSGREGKECIPVDVIERMAAVMEPPDDTKPYASFERFHVSVENTGNNFNEGMNIIKNNEVLNEIDQCLHKSLGSPILPKNELSKEEMDQLEQQRRQQQEETLKCQIQRIDQLLRKLVGAVGRVEKKRSREANDTRKSIMERSRKEDDLIALSDESVVNQFACLILGTEINSDWTELDNALVHSINRTFQEFLQDRSSKE